MSSSFLPLLASEPSCVSPPIAFSTKMGLVALPRWLPHCTVPEPRFAVSVHSVRANRERWGRLRSSGELGIGNVLALGDSKVRDTELGSHWSFFLSLSHSLAVSVFDCPLFHFVSVLGMKNVSSFSFIKVQ